MINMPRLAKDDFFDKIAQQGFAITYDDVRMKTGHSKVLPANVDVRTRFSRNISLQIPIVSAAMDTVTEHQMAIGIARLGGLGIIHKNMSVEQQASEVATVKYHMNGIIEKPISLRDDQTIEQLLNMKQEKDYKFDTFPIINSNGTLVGLITKHDIDFCNNYSLPISQVMTRKPIVEKDGLSIENAYKTMKSRKIKVLPLVNGNRKLKGMYVFSDVKRLVDGNQSGFNLDSKGQLIVGAAIGVGEAALERLEALMRKKVDVIVIDTAHGDTDTYLDTLKQIKSKYCSLDVVVGNISEASSAKNLIDAGADGIKIGQGPGSICTTRIIAGIGCPQVTAIYNCAKIAEEYGIPVCADGGLRYPGDIPIAIGAGAYSVMMGSMLAGTDEAPGEFVFQEGRRWKTYRGMGSLGAMTASKESRERYRQSGKNRDELIPEGVEGIVPYKGTLREVIVQYIGGLRNGMGYVGVENIDELRTKADFYLLTAAARAESHPHDIKITKEAPNYQVG